MPGGSGEVLNELKRLQDVISQNIEINANLTNVITELQNSNNNLAGVIVELQNQVAQQIITNTNLTNAITELQNQVTQQTTTNTNLTNVITELQTSVTRLTTITGQLVTVNIRALDDTDIPHLPLPYNTVPYNKSKAAVANNSDAALDFTSADWGVGNDWSTFILIVDFYDTSNYLTKKTHCFQVALLNLAGDYCFRESINAKDVNVSLFGTLYRMHKTFFIPSGFQTSSAQTLRVFVRNQTGVNLDQILAYIVGVPS